MLACVLHLTTNPGVIDALWYEYVKPCALPAEFTTKEVSKGSHTSYSTRALTALHSNCSINAIISCSTGLIVGVREDAWLRTIILHSEVECLARVDSSITLTAIQIIFVSNGSITNLVVDARLWT